MIHPATPGRADGSCPAGKAGQARCARPSRSLPIPPRSPDPGQRAGGKQSRSRLHNRPAGSRPARLTRPGPGGHGAADRALRGDRAAPAPRPDCGPFSRWEMAAGRGDPPPPHFLGPSQERSGPLLGRSERRRAANDVTRRLRKSPHGPLPLGAARAQPPPRAATAHALARH